LLSGPLDSRLRGNDDATKEARLYWFRLQSQNVSLPS